MPQLAHGAKRPARARRLAGLAAVALAVAAAIAAAVGLPGPGAGTRALLRMPPEERRAVYERAMENLRALCGQGPRTDALERQCIEQVQFVLQFPECDDACRAIGRMHQPQPTK